MLGNDVVLCIVGNKIDLEKDRRVNMQVAEEYARSVNAKLFNTSAKLNRGIEELFNDIATRKFYLRNFIIDNFIFKGMLEKVPSNSNESNTVRQSGIPIQPQSPPTNPKSNSCC
jgi:Ras-related protein Rab-21